MSDNAKPPRRRVWKYVLFLVIAGLLVLAALAWYTTTDSFQAAVHRRLVSFKPPYIAGLYQRLSALRAAVPNLELYVRLHYICGRKSVISRFTGARQQERFRTRMWGDCSRN